MFFAWLCFSRGEIIGNAVADKREKLYENMQIGSDYMFRVDEVSERKRAGGGGACRE